MGQLSGYLQKQIYIERELWPFIQVLCSKKAMAGYQVVNEALWDFVRKHLSKEDQKLINSLFDGAKHERKGSTNRRNSRRTDRKSKSRDR